MSAGLTTRLISKMPDISELLVYNNNIEYWHEQTHSSPARTNIQISVDFQMLPVAIKPVATAQWLRYPPRPHL